jgi:hypothetical protein
MADITGHTPVPWSIGKRRWITSGDVDIARIHSVSKIGENEAVANAEFIVRACNSHDALLEALENLLGQLENVSDYCQTCSEYWSNGDGGDLLHQPGCATDAAYEARNKAKGGA